jgi:hypothetical protein
MSAPTPSSVRTLEQPGSASSPHPITGADRVRGALQRIAASAMSVSLLVGVAVALRLKANWRRKISNVTIAGSIAVLAMGFIAVTTASPAQAAGCSDGNRSQAASWAAAGNFTTPRVVTWTERHTVPNYGGWGGPVGYDTYNYKLELRYNVSSRCVWGLYNGHSTYSVYIDRSTNGGQNWSGWLGPQSGTSAYTGVYNDAYPYVSRACVNTNPTRCTAWF